MTDLGGDWRVVDGLTTAWFEARSLTEGAALAARVTQVAPGAAVDVRASGVRVRLESDEEAAGLAGAICDEARALGLVADPAVLQALNVVLESPDPSALRPFWRGALGDVTEVGDRLVDPLRRDPAFAIRESSEERPLRNRIHVDVVRPSDAVEHAGLGEASGPYGVCHADADGNEVDLVPGGPLDESDEPSEATSDWQTVFSAVAAYRVPSSAQQRDLAGAAAALADAAGFPLLIDLRPGFVVLDTGKDQGDAEAHGLDLDFADLAARLQTAAREIGATADLAVPRFVQLALDAADVAAVRAFWAAALGYVHDRRTNLTDLVDPRRLNAVVMFQDIDVEDTERRRQRNRILLELAVPADLAAARVAAIVAAGGRLLDETGTRWRLADPEGNELVVVAG
ncbi:hypothetical protein CWIS_00970 [Cellulomonas sp. A375-1]|uniref:VOC family protein n=1 Tax=Cellulomonas sp. A375-1 TaxID=1672219 RepID=UPI0006527CF0|nr:VOC family protein [Cellulomonas sp. A375-1]KMM47220.1 hypothetical protein CWIS_00970 [Cellulomonas sp. A375-1]